MSSPELELEEARQIKEFNERARTRSSTIKRRDGLLKKAEQLRRLGNIDVALCLFDPVSDEYWVYRSRDDDNWPPSIESMVREPCVLLFRSWTHLLHHRKSSPR